MVDNHTKAVRLFKVIENRISCDSSSNF